jgi:hypothetical protein
MEGNHRNTAVSSKGLWSAQQPNSTVSLQSPSLTVNRIIRPATAKPQSTSEAQRTQSPQSLQKSNSAVSTVNASFANILSALQSPKSVASSGSLVPRHQTPTRPLSAAQFRQQWSHSNLSSPAAGASLHAQSSTQPQSQVSQMHLVGTVAAPRNLHSAPSMTTPSRAASQLSFSRPTSAMSNNFMQTAQSLNQNHASTPALAAELKTETDTDVLEQANRALQQVDAKKDDFFAKVCHILFCLLNAFRN